MDRDKDEDKENKNENEKGNEKETEKENEKVKEDKGKEKEGEKEQLSNDFTCILCGFEEGAVKPTKDGRWAHVMCALWIPEASFVDATIMVGCLVILFFI